MNKLIRLLRRPFLVLMALLAFAVRADNAGPTSDFRLLLGLGYGQYSSVLQQGTDSQFYLLPRWQLYYRKFYVENLDIGLNLLENQHWSVDLTGKQSFDALLTRHSQMQDSFLKGLLTSSVPVLIPIQFGTELRDYITPTRRHLSYLAGTTLYYRQPDWQFSTAWHRDISNVHHGSEWLSELNYQWQQPDYGLQLTATVRRLDDNYSNYYFGVNPADLVQNAYVHRPGQQWLPSVRLAVRYRLTDQMDWVANWRREYLPSVYRKSLYFDRLTHDLWFTGVLLQW
ncbi:MipA/OmpV family protein [Rheinheimera sp. F8]|uniref:MipA/OmpV family protein n=1 Tax=Rheinheimera sp. F8 TaxID=1763998 RepID=UPI0007449568|nr:MipA/OmpV family protein [Rheinheimera sp. F8]ALZ77296.1 hypothetical protein ATY27_17045 [Rheinheimera sp. F8]